MFDSSQCDCYVARVVSIMGPSEISPPVAEGLRQELHQLEAQRTPEDQALGLR